MAADNPFESFALKMEHMAAELDDKMPDVIATSIMVELEAQHKQRIFGEGRKSDGSKIGEYSKKPTYYSKEVFIRKAAFKAKGKKDRGNFKNGNERKTMYLPGGYTELRDIQGRQTEFVDQKYSGSQERSIGIVKLGTAVLYGMRDLIESKKLEGNIKRFGDFISLSPAEKEFLKTEIPQQATLITNKYA